MFPIIELEADFSIDDEAMGSKTKYWVKLPDKEGVWLFKFARANTGEAWSEKVAAEIAELMGIQHAVVELGRFRDHRSLSRRFPELNTGAIELIHGNELLAGYLNHYDQYKVFKQRDHTLKNILRVVGRLFSNPEARHKALAQLSGYVVLDALIMNTDRHHENWALLRKSLEDGTVTHSVAPTYDHASSLGRELLDEKLVAWMARPGQTATYVEKAKGAIFVEGAPRGANPLAIAELAHSYDSTLIIPWIDRLRDLKDEDFHEIFEQVPREVLNDRAKDFAFSIIKHTRDRLCEIK